MPVDGARLIEMRVEWQFHMISDSRAVRDGLQRALEAEPLCLLSVDDRSTAEIVLAEVLNNIVEHAYAAGTGPIRLSLALGEGVLNCRIEDEGAAMPGETLPAGRLPNPADLPEGGFGWHLIRTLGHQLSYRRSGSTNQLRFSLPAERSGR
ncbi:MAG: ATP-binding protein [Rhodobacter sp.]|jgi:serine/threonine-protein kinase RsbW|nr:ATP-binding protein [Rhodobacter sp.]